MLRAHRDLIPDLSCALATGRAGLAAQALLHAGAAYTRGAGTEALAASSLAGRLAPVADVRDLLEAYARGDDRQSMTLTRAALGRLVPALHGTRYGTRVSRMAAGDPAWEASCNEPGAPRRH